MDHYSSSAFIRDTFIIELCSMFFGDFKLLMRIKGGNKWKRSLGTSQRLIPNGCKLSSSGNLVKQQAKGQ